MIFGIAAFGFTLSRINAFNEYHNETDESFIPDIRDNTYFDGFMYIFAQSLGGYSSDSGYYAQNLVLSLIVLSAMINCIIMMNLLIAIISDSFARVNSYAPQAAYREKAALIYENSFLLHDSVKTELNKPQKYLLYIKAMKDVITEEDKEKKEQERVD
jgi:hypothetical protein